MRSISCALALIALAACGGDDEPGADAATVIDPTADLTRDIVSTGLKFALGPRTGVADIALGASTGNGASLEVGDLQISRVSVAGGADLPFAIADHQLDLGVGPEPVVVRVEYTWNLHENSDGVDSDGFTLTWPYFCGNVFPCHSNPADGTTFTMEVTTDTADTVVYPRTIPGDAPSYMAAWAVGNYTRTVLGTTTAGTTVVAWGAPTETAAIAQGTAHLTAAFDWLEQNLGPYRFGTEVGTVSARWGRNAYGGMEHHPLWHVASDAMADESVQVHEASHGWFGDGVRIECWEDFVLSEGAASYYEARVVEEVGAEGAGTAAWTLLDNEVAGMRSAGGVSIARPPGCGAIDVLTDGLFSRVPYVKGAAFLRAVERKISRPRFDASMRAFYQRYGGKAAGVDDLLAVIEETSGYDATACAASWLSAKPVPAELTCL